MLDSLDITNSSMAFLVDFPGPWCSAVLTASVFCVVDKFTERTLSLQNGDFSRHVDFLEGAVTFQN